MKLFDKSDRCYNGGNKHNFVPRYTEQNRRGSGALEYYTVDELRRYQTLNIYVYDICTWCGKIVKK